MSTPPLSSRTRRPPLAPVWCRLAGMLSLAAPLTAQTPAPKAVPVEEESAAGPAPRPNAPRAVPVPETTPEPPSPRPRAAAPARPGRDKLVKSPEDDLFDYSELLFARASFALASQQYQQYLNLHPAGKYRDEAIFKLAECAYQTESWDAAIAQYDIYLRDFPAAKNRSVALYHAGEAHYKMASRVPAAEQPERFRLAFDAYRASLQTNRTGAYACYAAFRLGSFSYNAAQRDPERYKEAVRWFEIAASQCPKNQPRIRVTSLFYLGRSQRFLKNTKGAAATFDTLTKIKEDNIYFDQAWQELAQMDIEAGRTGEAMKKFERLALESSDAETRASSLVNTGMIMADTGRSAEAIAKFEEAINIPGDKARGARARARFGMVWSSYREKAYDKVVEAWRGLQAPDYGDLDETTRARLWLIAGMAYASLDKHAYAAQTLKLLEGLNLSPEKEVMEICLEGGYKRIVSLFKLGDPQTPDAVDGFTAAWQERAAESPWIDKAHLVKGAWYFNRSVWDASARAYKNVRAASLDPAKTATWLYQRGCAEAYSGDKEAVATLSSFLEQAPGDERWAMAQLQRGLIRLKLDDTTNALADFETVARKVPGTETAETAAYHTARIKGMKQDFQGMVDGFVTLLTDYPKTRVAGEANYWIGTGRYQLQKYQECLDPLRQARTLEGRTYFQDASLMLIAALAALKDVDGLITEVDAYLQATASKKINPDILRWLGMTLFLDRKDYPRAARYLGAIVTPDAPEKTAADVWAAHGESLLEIKDFTGAIRSLDHYLKTEQRPAQRARTFLLRGRAQFLSASTEEALKSVEEGLNIDRETLIAAQLHLLSGDIAVAGNRHKEAISSYNAVRAGWEDPVFTPTAIWKMVTVLEKSTDPRDQTEAASLKKDLEKHYPRFQP